MFKYFCRCGHNDPHDFWYADDIDGHKKFFCDRVDCGCTEYRLDPLKFFQQKYEEIVSEKSIK